MATQRIEVITGREGRRQYSAEEKLGLVEAAFAPGVRRAEFARRAGVDQSLLYRWLCIGFQIWPPDFCFLNGLQRRSASKVAADAHRRGASC